MNASMLIRTAAAALLVATATPASAQTSVATVATVTGTAEVQPGSRGDWQPLAVGSAIAASDALRTAANSALRLVFVDDVVVTMGPSTTLRIQRYATARAARRALLRVEQGAMQALVSGYGGETARFEVETPTAVVRVQGTDFIVHYEPDQRATDVVALDGSVAVQGTTGIIGPGVTVSANEMTRVPADGFPSPAAPLKPEQARDFTKSVQVAGPVPREGLDRDNPIMMGKVVGPNDRPGVAVAAAPTPEAGPYLHPDVPGQTLLQTLSPDMRANTQPLPVYRRVKPNDSPDPRH